jgi:hypothetical protein
MHSPHGPVFLRLFRYNPEKVLSTGSSGSGHGANSCGGIGGGSHTGERTTKEEQAVVRHDAARIG